MSLDQPRFRRDLEAVSLEADGQRYVDVRDPSTGVSFRLYDFEYHVALAFDGLSFETIVPWLKLAAGITVEPAQLREFAARLDELGFLERAEGEGAPPPVRTYAVVAPTVVGRVARDTPADAPAGPSVASAPPAEAMMGDWAGERSATGPSGAPRAEVGEGLVSPEGDVAGELAPDGAPDGFWAGAEPVAAEAAPESLGDVASDSPEESAELEQAGGAASLPALALQDELREAAALPEELGANEVVAAAARADEEAAIGAALPVEPEEAPASGGGLPEPLAEPPPEAAVAAEPAVSEETHGVPEAIYTPPVAFAAASPGRPTGDAMELEAPAASDLVGPPSEETYALAPWLVAANREPSPVEPPEGARLEPAADAEPAAEPAGTLPESVAPPGERAEVAGESLGAPAEEVAAAAERVETAPEGVELPGERGERAEVAGEPVAAATEPVAAPAEHAETATQPGAAPAETEETPAQLVETAANPVVEAAAESETPPAPAEPEETPAQAEETPTQGMEAPAELEAAPAEPVAVAIVPSAGPAALVEPPAAEARAARLDEPVTRSYADRVAGSVARAYPGLAAGARAPEPLARAEPAAEPPEPPAAVPHAEDSAEEREVPAATVAFAPGVGSRAEAATPDGAGDTERAQAPAGLPYVDIALESGVDSRVETAEEPKAAGRADRGEEPASEVVPETAAEPRAEAGAAAKAPAAVEPAPQTRESVEAPEPPPAEPAAPPARHLDSTAFPVLPTPPPVSVPSRPPVSVTPVVLMPLVVTPPPRVVAPPYVTPSPATLGPVPPAIRRRQRRSLLLFGSLGVLTAAAVLAIVLPFFFPPRGPSRARVRTLAVAPGPIVRYFASTGTVAPLPGPVLKFPSAGRVLRVAKPGTVVVAGDILAAVEAARPLLGQLAQQRERLAFSQQMAEGLRQAGNASEADRQAAKVEERKARIAKTLRALSELAVVAARSGTVEEAFTREGESVEGGSLALRLGSSGHRATFDLPGAQAAEARRLGFCQVGIDGHLFDCTPSTDRAEDGRVSVELPVLPAALVGRPARLARARWGGAVVLPASAIQNAGRRPQVLAVSPSGRVEVRPVTVAEQGATEAIVTQGLDAGDRVIVAPPGNLRPGASVVPHS